MAVGQNSASEWFQIGLSSTTPEQKIRAFERVVALDPNYIEAYFYLGLAYKVKGQLTEAEVALNKAYFKNPYALSKEIKTRILFELADIYKTTGKLEKAKEAFIGARDLAGNNRLKGRIHYELGLIYLDEGDIAGALEELRRGRALLPANAAEFDQAIARAESKRDLVTNYNLALQALNRGDYRRATALLGQVVQADPNFKDAREQLTRAQTLLEQDRERARLQTLYDQARAKLRAGDRTGATELLQRIVSADPNFRDAAERLRRLRSQPAPQRPAPQRQDSEDAGVEDDYARGRRALNRGDWSRALSALQRVQAQRPGYKDVERLIAEARRNQEREQRVQTLYQQAQALTERGAWSRALEVLQELQSLQPGYRDVAQLLQRTRQALASVEPEEGQIDSLYQAGLRALQNGEWEQAVRAFEQVQVLDATYQDVANRLADARFHLAKQSNGVARKREASSEANGLLWLAVAGVGLVGGPVAFLLFSPALRARLFLLRGKYRQAAKLYEKLLAKNPGRVKYYPLLAEIYLLENRRDEQAIRVFEKVLRLDLYTRHKAEINSLMANHYLTQRRTDPNAIETLERELHAKIKNTKPVV